MCSQVFPRCAPKSDLCCSKPQMVITQQAAEKSEYTVSLHLSQKPVVYTSFSQF